MKNMGIYADKKPKVSSKNGRKKSSSSIYYDLPSKISQKPFWLKYNKTSKDGPDSKFSDDRMKYLMEKYRELVHYNSPEPEKYGVRAFTKNSKVYIAPGEESALPHELAHVYQQKTQNIPATGEINGQKVNLDPQLEQKADEMAEGKVKDLDLLKGKNRTKNIIQFEFDPKKPGEHQEERRDYYKDRLTAIICSEMYDNLARYIDNCKSVDNISNLLRIILKKYWPDSDINPTVNLSGMNLDLAKANAKQLLLLMSKYSTSIHDIKFERMEAGRAGVSGEFEHTGGRTLKFSSTFFNDKEPIESTKEKFADGEETQMRIKNHADIRTREEKRARESSSELIEKLLKYTVTHEFGHSILSYAALNKSLITSTQENIYNCITKIYNKYMSKYGPSSMTGSDFISKYARTSVEEFIAESFAQSELSSNPESVSIYAKKLMEIIDTFFAWNPEVRPEDFNWNEFKKSLSGL